MKYGKDEEISKRNMKSGRGVIVSQRKGMKEEEDVGWK